MEHERKPRCSGGCGAILVPCLCTRQASDPRCGQDVIKAVTRLRRLEEERLKKQDKEEAVLRLKRAEAHAMHKTQQRLEESDRKTAELRHRQYLMHQEKLKAKKEQEVMKLAIQGAVEKMRKTHR